MSVSRPAAIHCRRKTTISTLRQRELGGDLLLPSLTHSARDWLVNPFQHGRDERALETAPRRR